MCGCRRRPSASAAGRSPCRRPRQPLSRAVDAVAHPCGVGATGGAAGPGVDVRPGVADGRARVVGRLGGRAGDGVPDPRCAGPHRSGPLVGSGGLAAEADQDHRCGRGGVDAAAGIDRPARHGVERRRPDRRVGGDGERQRVGVHRDRRDRRPVLERARAGHPEHHATAGDRVDPAHVRGPDHRGRVPRGVRGVRAVRGAGDPAGAAGSVVISTGVRSASTFSISGKRFRRASLAVIAITAPP